MQIVERKWTWKDAPSAITMALSPTRLLVGMAGIFVAEVFGWLFGKIWAPENLYTVVGNLRALVVSAIVLYILYATVALIGRGVYLELEEGEGLSIKDNIGFLFTTGVRTAFAPFVFLGLMAVLWALCVLGFLFGRLWSGFAAILFLPLMILIILAGMAGLLAVYGLYIAPGSAGVRKSGALDTVLDTVDMLRGRGVFWGFALTVAAIVLLGMIIGFFYQLGMSAVATGAGLVPLQGGGPEMVSVNWIFGLLSGASVAENASNFTDWLWVIALKIFQLVTYAFLLCTFAGSGVIGYLVGSEDEVVVVEEKRTEGGAKAAPSAVKKEEKVAKAEEAKSAGGDSDEEKKSAARKQAAAKKPHVKKEKEDEGDAKADAGEDPQS